MNIPVVTVGNGVTNLVGDLERLHGPVTVVRRCAELSELIAACQSGIARAAIVADDAGEVTAALAERLAATGVALLVLADEEGSQQRLDALSIAHAPRGSAAELLSDLVSDAVGRMDGRSASTLLADPSAALRTWSLDAAGAPDRGAGRGDSAAGRTNARTDGGEDGDRGQESGDDIRAAGTVVAVWGPTGAPGRTTVAVNFAAEAAADGKTVLLVDADTYGSSVAASLGLLDESAGVAQACRLADQGLLDPQSLLRSTLSVSLKGQRLLVLTGITRSDRWIELRPTALGLVLEQARKVADLIVIDCGFSLEADEELSFDTLAPRRNGATLRALELADTVYAVGAADSVGVPRLVRALAELEAAVPGSAPKVVLNKVRSAAVGRSPERQLSDAWERFGPGIPVTAFLPADFSTVDAALLAGSALLETAPSSPLRHAIAALANVRVSSRRRSKRVMSAAK
ncbi:chromosome partitioning protein [Arthrobacter sp. zg-Y820]|uniref:AAA family ATPase n=1 Tax=unclassified Arthrobacter TaxID=235627 RepID=UPI001E4B2915|nr:MULTISPECIES: chromosome partitioning protein [unclassified Arthrobacter]MCC9195992.1 chromosome partitioning protein [Arthrobacter sp. zg-Y820]MDK1278851.1 chromosome partitioning protein [Arthrobacter sp. zg.Y820]WIB08733.1 chromosome partitioning protein [Arthrobacter sp. zg-Y820]